MERVLPFLISGVLIIVGLATTSRLNARLKRYVTGATDMEILDGVPERLQPGSLGNVVLYWVDLTQATALLVGPVLGLLTVVDLSQAWVAGVYAVAILGGICLLLWLALAADESSYSSSFGWLGFTPVTAIALVIDVAAGVIAYFV
jgi:hypothetical protein